jgi:hypothetical protein
MPTRKFNWFSIDLAKHKYVAKAYENDGKKSNCLQNSNPASAVAPTTFKQLCNLSWDN